MASISERKAAHIEVAASGQADFRRSTLLEDVHLVHQALPELHLDNIDLRTEFLGHTLAAPIAVSGMTGGTHKAGAINCDIARAAQACGVAFGVGSQRAMLTHPDLESTFQVRHVAPDVVLIGNLGVVQAKTYGAARVQELAKRLQVNAMAIHLNPGQELIQQGGDRDFTGGLDTIARVRDALSIPLVVKETGCGISPQVAASLARLGVDAVDVSGAGGTSWVAVEARRAAEDSAAQRLGHELWDWGIPTAVSVAASVAGGVEAGSGHRMQVMASGGLRSGLDIARALALGATVGGMAAPVLRAQQAGGVDGARALLEELVASVRAVALLTGCARARDLSTAPRHIGARLRGWLDDLGVR